jgi:P-type E1-E2 ATPase
MPGIVLELGGQRTALRHLVCDLNGTLAQDGHVMAGVADRLAALSGTITVHVVSGDTFGTADAVGRELGIAVTRLDADRQGLQKRREVERLGADSVIVIGNGRNDRLAMERAALAICVIGPEGASTHALRAADIVVTSGCDALDLLLQPGRIIATLRT